MKKIVKLDRILLAACASVLSFASAVQAQEPMIGTPSRIRSLGLIDVRNVPAPTAAESRRPMFETEEPRSPRLSKTAPLVTTVDKSVGQPTSEVAATLQQDFEGIIGSGLEPPDPILAVGPNDVLIATNGGLQVFNKSGTALTGVLSPSSFFGANSQFEIQSDPKVIYDAESGRYFGVWIGYDSQTDTGAWFLVVSTSSSATGTFQRYQIDEPASIPDFPGLGVCTDKIVLTANDFNGAGTVYKGVVAVALDKSAALAGSIPASSRFFNVQESGGGQAFTASPVQSMNPTTTCNMVAISQNGQSIQNYKITGLPPSASLATLSPVTLPRAVTTPVDATQKGSTRKVTTGGSIKIRGDASYRNVNGGSIWLGSNTGCRFSRFRPTVTCLHLAELQNVDTTPTLRQQIIFGAADTWSYYPAIRTDNSNNATLVYTRSSSTEFPSLRYTTRLDSAPLGLLEASVQLVAGSAAYTGSRWGDYQGAALDPSDNRSIWIYGEYKRTGSGFWQTRFGQTIVP